MAVFASDPKGHADQHLLLYLFFATCQGNVFSLSTPLTLVWLVLLAATPRAEPHVVLESDSP